MDPFYCQRMATFFNLQRKIFCNVFVKDEFTKRLGKSEEGLNSAISDSTAADIIRFKQFDNSIFWLGILGSKILEFKKFVSET